MRLPGQIDQANLPRAYDQLYAAFVSGATVVIADLTATTSCDAACLRQLIAVQRRAAAQDAQLRLVIPPGSPLRRLVQLTTLDALVPVYPSLGRAAADDSIPASRLPAPGHPPSRCLPGPAGAAGRRDSASPAQDQAAGQMGATADTGNERYTPSPGHRWQAASVIFIEQASVDGADVIGREAAAADPVCRDAADDGRPDAVTAVRWANRLRSPSPAAALPWPAASAMPGCRVWTSENHIRPPDLIEAFKALTRSRDSQPTALTALAAGRDELRSQLARARDELRGERHATATLRKLIAGLSLELGQVRCELTAAGQVTPLRSHPQRKP